MSERGSAVRAEPGEDGFEHGGWGAGYGNPFTAHMNAVSRTLDGDLAIVGSTALVRSLHAAGLVDHHTLVIHPPTLGSGARLFGAPGSADPVRADQQCHHHEGRDRRALLAGQS